MTGEGGSAAGGPRAQLRRVREEPRTHWVALVVAILAGLVLATLHWVGLAVGGALVGLVAASLRRAVVAGLGFGLLVVGLWLGLFALSGTLGKVLAMGEIALLGVAMALVAPVLGSLVRGII